MTLFVMGAVSGCVNDDFATDGFEQTTIKEGLAVSPFVSESQEKHAYTRADEDTTPSDGGLQEKTLNTLDVFVQHITDGTPDTKIMNAYHLPLVPDKPYADQAEHFLAENWRTEGLVEGQYYNIYVAANSTQTQSISAGDDVSVLTGLVYDENEDNAIFNPTKKEFEWKDNQPCGDIYKLYTSELIEYQDEQGNTQKYRALTNSKEFMMDGILKNWTPESGQKKQVFQPVIMNRAAAKIVMNLSFDADFLKSLTHTKEIVKDKDGKDVETWVEKPAEEKVTITGTPAWRFFNFAFGAPVFAPEGNDWTGVSVLSSDFQIREKEGYSGNNMQHSIITYSYPNKWDDVSGAPSMIVSIGYTQNGNTSYNYYRIPIVPKATKTLDRNHIYVVNATIATRGSESHEDITEMEDLVYEVLPWNDRGNEDAIENNVEAVQHYYFKVNPKVYTLRGDGDQTVVLNYLKATGTKVNWKLFTYGTDGKQTAVVANDAAEAIRAWFYNSAGDFTTTYNDNSGTDWSKMGVNIVQSKEGTSGSEGTVTVTSTALNNKAIKYIRLRVYLDGTNEQGVALENDYHQDIIIRHFPTDNVQSIEGLWSSYTGASSTHTLTTTDINEANQWLQEYSEYGATLTESTVSDVTYIDRSTYLANASDSEHYHMVGPTESNYSTFHQMVPNMNNRQSANSLENAVPDAGEGESYYYGTDATIVYTGWRYSGEYDFTTSAEWYQNNYHKYSHYYVVTYTYTPDPHPVYYVTYTTQATSNWVDWTDQTNHTGRRTYSQSYSGGGQFRAKVYQENERYKIWSIVDQQQNGNTYRTVRGNTDRLTSLDNPHMYVIQISSTSTDYILGRPYVNESTHQSQDNVVAPAFMIASQLGAVQQFRGDNAAAHAAEHCSKYMEVTEDGVRYTGWRLPTQAEIGVISSYQNGVIDGVRVPAEYRTMNAVLTGTRYWCLSGNRINTNTNQVEQTGDAYLRCVRDLSAEEVEILNDFEAIQEQYR